MSNGQDAPDPLLPQDLNLIIAGVTTTPEARAAAKALLLEGLVTDAQRILEAMNGSAAALTQSVTNLRKLHAFLELSPLTQLANQVAQLEAKLRERIVQTGTAVENAIIGVISAETEAENDAVGAAAPGPSVNVDLPAEPPVDVMDTPDPVPDEGPDAFVSAHRAAPKTVIYVDASGRETVRESGSRAWRNNNPGNIRRGSFSRANGAIGDDDAFAIFPTERVGFNAIVTLLRGPSYSPLTLEAAIARYAPPSENNTHGYIDFVTSQTQLHRSVVLSSLSANKIRAIAGAIKRKEGWTPGVERSVSSAGAPEGDGVAVSSAAAAAHEWMAIAEREAALPEHERSEWPDPGENPRILNYFKAAASWFDAADGDETDWCAAFVNFCLVTSGHDGTNHPGARSFFWNKSNRFVRISSPQPGCIAVRRHAPFDDLAWTNGPGHVGFVVASSSSTVTLLGGNQHKTVCRKSYHLETRNANGALMSKFVAFLLPAMN